MIKPRLKKSKVYDLEHDKPVSVWGCKTPHEICSYAGNTPKEAYLNWRSQHD